MLQIKSGKLFVREPEYENELRAVIYTSLQIYRSEPIETAAGRLLSVDTLRNSRAIIYEFTELIEAQPSGKGALISHGADPYVKEFAVVLSFALNVICAENLSLIERLTSRLEHVGTQVRPDKIICRFFDQDVPCTDSDIQYLISFVERLISLERSSYLAAVRAMRTLLTGLHRLSDDLALAYTLMVASIESLAQGFDDHQVTWDDFDEIKRRPIDTALKNVDIRLRDAVRAAILEGEHIALSRRFVEFSITHLTPSYFREEAQGQIKPIGRAELRGALREAYRLRSSYIHRLQDLPRELVVGVDLSETISLDGATLLTFQGLLRLARHVITQFIERRPKVKRELYDYRLEPPGIMFIQLAPECWVGNALGVRPEMGSLRLSGFLEQLSGHFARAPNATVTDLRDLLLVIESMLPQMAIDKRRPWIALYLLFNYFAPPEVRLTNSDSVRAKFGDEITSPSIESLIFHLILDQVPNWDCADHAKIHSDYFRFRSRKSSIRLTRELEAGMSLVLAERYRLQGDIERAREFVKFAVENYPGHAKLREIEVAFHDGRAINWRAVVFPDKP